MLRHDLKIYSFREEKETRKFVFFGSLAVDADSAKIGDGKEEVGSIPEDHSNMTKFAGKFDRLQASKLSASEMDRRYQKVCDE